METKEKIAQLRAGMALEQLDAYVVPSADPHQSEYVGDHWRCRQWISGFTGSTGTAAILVDQAGLWTDGRYFIQAEQELQGSGIDLFRMQMPEVPELIDWLCDNVPRGGAVGVDGRQLTAAQAREWTEKLSKKNIRLMVDCDLVSKLWKDRPALPDAPVTAHGDEYAGQSVAEKLQEIREAMREKEADHYLISSLYDIAWLLNIRGGDIAHCPVVMAYALVDAESVQLFIDEAKVPDIVRAVLEGFGAEIKPYDAIIQTVETLPAGTTVYLDEKRVNTLLRQSIPSGCKVETGAELTGLPKARKNKIQLEQWAKVQELDGVAMVRFLKWIEEQLSQGGLTECVAADRLEAFRKSHPDCLDLSFSPISAYGPNAAMMHYSPQPESCATLEPHGFYLIDSGGQYAGGTTDITRTVALGDLTDEQRTDYTLVLKGVINLSTARFLKGSCGMNLDILARQPLWQQGLDYKCGTGHGVGQYLSVHEGPQNFSQAKRSDTPLEPGMVVTIEPGVYKEGRHGIRIENMVGVVEDCETESGTFYRFDVLTLCPIDTAPLRLELLAPSEQGWLNQYHQAVRGKLAPYLSAEEAAWLEAKTQPVGV
jgi:Xaa-Pro aminopeptidase